MVKNTTGGSKTKGQARKLVSFDSKTANKMLRLSTDICEVYAQVTKNLGNGMCHVLCADTKTRLCHIRGKFRGRGKRDNMVGLGSWILVGLREWEIGKDDAGKKLENCDLLEVYSDYDKEKLKTTVTTINWTSFISNDNKNSKLESDSNDIEFTDNIDEYRSIIEEKMKTGQKIESIQVEKEEEEIDIDDI
jgi:translation initiation factor 1A